MSDSQDVQNESMVAFVRSQTFRKRADLDILFVAIDIERGAVLKAWLVPSADFAEVIGEPDTRGRLRFVASMKEGSQDRWAHRRLEAAELAPAILGQASATRGVGREVVRGIAVFTVRTYATRQDYEPRLSAQILR
jgi:hypothetical protein